jgi:hypothetical protein
MIMTLLLIVTGFAIARQNSKYIQTLAISYIFAKDVMRYTILSID